MGLKVIPLCIVLAFLTACQKSTDPSGSGGYRPQTPEKPYSATPTAYPPPVTTITATARFDRYNDTGANGLNSIETNLPIRFAEVHILDANGNQIQQGETDASGNISLNIPRAAGTYTLRVNSRADNAQYKVSVLKDPYDTQYYSLDQSFSLAGSEGSAPVTMSNATANNAGAVLGGAFNIMDQVYLANVFLRSQAYSASCPMCSNDFSVAPKIQIFWQKGLTPATYYGEPTVPISFFLGESSAGFYRGIYILGGIEGDVCTDTDHFDRSVVLHEYGHFLENALGKSASPGGSHNGDEMLDPRLAWSEGWADFFQAAVLGRSYYRDTKRNGGCAPVGMGATAQLSFPDFNLETQGLTDLPDSDEGIFREISIARTLYDIMTGPSQSASYNMTNDTDGHAVDMGFAPLWNAFKSMGSSSFKFQNMGQLNSLTDGYSASYSAQIQTDFQAALNHEEQADTERLYGQLLTPTSGTQGACTFTVQTGTPVPDNRDSEGYITYSDPLKSNDYYRYDYDGSAAKAVVIMRYRKTGGVITNPYDLDVYVYNEKHILLDPTDIVTRSEGIYPESGGNGTYPGYEYINFTGLPAGTYLINVKVYYTANRATTGYFLENPSGAQLCP